METKTEQYTYEEHKQKFIKDPGKYNVTDYIQEFICVDINAKDRLVQICETNQLSSLSRILDKLPTIFTKKKTESDVAQTISHLQKLKEDINNNAINPSTVELGGPKVN
ncbi:hypothetical protein ACNVED_04405 [Legionella sp. D16C41]|uniref:hypothetical protein n=1 Tax=Legionella sp. D16C41 TaxID=3402688 RepID=UPI003AF7BE39